MSQAKLMASAPAENHADINSILASFPADKQDSVSAHMLGLRKAGVPWLALLQWFRTDGIPLIKAFQAGTATIDQIMTAIADKLPARQATI